MPALVRVEVCVWDIYVSILTLGASKGTLFDVIPIHSLKVADATIKFLAETQRANCFGVMARHLECNVNTSSRLTVENVVWDIDWDAALSSKELADS